MRKFTFARMGKKKKIACAIVTILLVFGVGLGVYGTLSNTGSYDNEYAYGSQEDLEKQVREYISNYFTTQNVGKLSDDELAELIAEITNGVLNNVETDNVETQLSAEQQNEIRAIIADAAKKSVDEYNKALAADQASGITESVKNELIQYIDNTVVPGLTKQITENTNSISTLKQMFSNLEAKVNIGISRNTVGISKTTLDEEIANAKVALKALIDAETEGRMTEDTDLSNRIDMVKSELEAAIDERISDVREELTTKINENTELTKRQKNELITQLEQMDATNTSNLNDIKVRLDECAKGADDALKTAVSDLNSQIEDVRVDLNAAVERMKQYTDDQTQQVKDELTQQIIANAALSESQRQELSQKIDDLQIKSEQDLADARNEIQQYVDELSAENKEAFSKALDDATNKLLSKDDFAANKKEILDKINSNEELDESQRQLLADAINQVSTDSNKNIADAKTEINTVMAQKLEELNGNMNSAIDNLKNRMSANETNIGNANSAISGLGNRMSANENNINNANSAINGLNNRVSTNETNIGRINDNVNYIGGRVSSNESSISGINSEIGSIKNNLDGKQNAMGTGVIAMGSGDLPYGSTVQKSVSFDHNINSVVVSMLNNTEDFPMEYTWSGNTVTITVTNRYHGHCGVNKSTILMSVIVVY